MKAYPRFDETVGHFLNGLSILFVKFLGRTVPPWHRPRTRSRKSPRGRRKWRGLTLLGSPLGSHVNPGPKTARECFSYAHGDNTQYGGLDVLTDI